ncbi:MAG: ATP-binding protein [Anaerolineae bacterium]|jgi:hypothetical protein|nr:ATP-binding protein [Anaerolineae bacterium]MDH7472866.1 hypothetical protein [Anaerolineae bacterium]
MTNPLAYFSDREREIDAFRAFLAAKDPTCWVWSLDGISGCGKTTLIHYLIQRVCAPQHVPTAMLDFSGELLCTDRGAVLDALEDQLYPGVPATAWERYHQQREKLLAELAAFRPTIHIDQRVLARGGRPAHPLTPPLPGHPGSDYRTATTALSRPGDSLHQRDPALLRARRERRVPA